ncbi:probable ATP-dependent RNA helicase DDX28 [Paramacrobiotus metropolitanus]|uniref:probable ATP-dependent RNA helicase DDX28 n=1 Tax=Paramacrobiotus metropolitanus TaxID=2943436 RepID=UPI0024462D89|nr:probable ATP-dependent RNA helicase DDX28 [Paramacrobiotus metropolitanus]XP_055353279.1 probable ATP-dependent RNA helicase DDX28 [Paramacrobiotus metropolitanus]XP_055353280.1 probable ATP-dependent RNA helicase DDX28 [Paramacrobiotus metropolitanus]
MLLSSRLLSIIRHLPTIRRYPDLQKTCGFSTVSHQLDTPRVLPETLVPRTPLGSSRASSHPPTFSTVFAQRNFSVSACLFPGREMRHTRSQDEEFAEHTPSGLPIIRLPTRLQGKVKRVAERKRQLDEWAREDRRRISERPLVIACKNREFNHRLGAPLALPKGRKGHKITHPKQNPRFLTLKLASQGWKQPKSKGDWFQIRPYIPFGGHPSLSHSFHDEQPGFEKFPLHPTLQQALRDFQFDASTAIQNSAIPPLLAGESAVLSAETGSGKTLAYLLPTLHRLMTEPRSREFAPNAPRALVLVPSRELVDQVFEVVGRVLQYDEVLQVEKRVGGGRHFRKVKEPQTGRVDLLIITPGILSTLLAKNAYTLSHIQTVILDECDTLLDDSFNHLTRDFLSRIPLHEGPLTCQPAADGSPDPTTLHQSPAAQLLLVGATTPLSLSKILDGVVDVDTLVRIKTQHTHRIQPHVLQTFLRVGKDEKPEKLLQLVRADQKGGLVTMVFCGTTAVASWLTRFMQENGLPAELIAKSVQAGNRAQRYAAFQKGGINIMVGTDVISRGIDTTFVDHVINYDFPRVVSDYIHRGGRVGRLGSGEQGRSRGRGAGRVTSLVAAKWEIPTVQAIEEAVRRTTEFRNVNANITRVMNARHGVDPLPEISGKGRHKYELSEEETEGLEKLF